MTNQLSEPDLGEESPIDKGAFAGYVKDALANLHDPVCLQTNPLAKLLVLEPASEENAAACLRALLLEIIESLQPAANIPLHSHEATGYRILVLRYAEAHEHAYVAKQLALSRASYYRRHQEAVEAVVSILGNRYQKQVAAQDDSSKPQLSHDERAKEEALRLARTLPRQSIDLLAVVESVRQTILPLAAEQRVTLTLDLPDALPRVFAEPSMIRHAILNVLTDALRLSKSGLLQVAVRPQEAEIVWEIRGLEGSVADQALRQLTGFLVGSALLEFYGGQVWLSCEAEGDVLRFTLPVISPKMILIIEDDTDTINLYRRYLRRTNYVVQVARSQEQLDALLADTRPDLILLDVLMPRLDGWTILQQLKTLPEMARIPVVICSVLSQERLALALGAARVLRKPVSSDTLVRTVEEFLAQVDSAG